MNGVDRTDRSAMQYAAPRATTSPWSLGTILSLLLLASPSAALAEPDRVRRPESMLERLIKTGIVTGADRGHRASGRAQIIRTDDGTLLLRIEQLEVRNGPALRVLLVEHPSPTSSRDIEADGSLDLGELRATSGDQEYVIPDNVDLSQIGSVVVYCKPYRVVFATATLKEP